MLALRGLAQRDTATFRVCRPPYSSAAAKVAKIEATNAMTRTVVTGIALSIDEERFAPRVPTGIDLGQIASGAELDGQSALAASRSSQASSAPPIGPMWR